MADRALHEAAHISLCSVMPNKRKRVVSTEELKRFDSNAEASLKRLLSEFDCADQYFEMLSTSRSSQRCVVTIGYCRGLGRPEEGAYEEFRSIG